MRILLLIIVPTSVIHKISTIVCGGWSYNNKNKWVKSVQKIKRTLRSLYTTSSCVWKNATWYSFDYRRYKWAKELPGTLKNVIQFRISGTQSMHCKYKILKFFWNVFWQLTVTQNRLIISYTHHMVFTWILLIHSFFHSAIYSNIHRFYDIARYSHHYSQN